jgi:hypothetical protein
MAVRKKNQSERAPHQPRLDEGPRPVGHVSIACELTMFCVACHQPQKVEIGCAGDLHGHAR